MPVCYRHPDRESHIRCQRCERPICPDCMTEAAVGFQCPSCVVEGRKSVRTATTTYGGRRPTRPGLLSQVLIGINVAVFVVLLATGGRGSPIAFELVLIPQQVAGGAVWQLLTSAFAHLDLLHIALNMYAIYLLGPQLEELLGRARFLALYLVSALAGSALVMAASAPFGATLGASGAVFGLFAAYLVVALRRRANLQPILIVIGINVLFTVIGRGFISWQGHLGGFLGGLLVAGALFYAPRQGRSRWQWTGVSATLLLVLAAIAARVAVLG